MLPGINEFWADTKMPLHRHTLASTFRQGRILEGFMSRKIQLHSGLLLAGVAVWEESALRGSVSVAQPDLQQLSSTWLQRPLLGVELHCGAFSSATLE